MIRALALAVGVLCLASCGSPSAEQIDHPARNATGTKLQTRDERIGRQLARHLEAEERKYRDRGAKTFCEVKIFGIGRYGVISTPPSMGRGRSGSVRGVPIYAYQLCDDFRPKKGILEARSGSSFPLRFVVENVDAGDLRVLNWRGPVDGAGNGESLRALFPDPYFARVRDDRGALSSELGCAAVTRARKHFALPDASVIDSSDACDPPS